MAVYKLSLTTDGSGDATGQWSQKFSGQVMGIRVEASGAAAGTDTTVLEPTGLQRTLLTLTDTNTDTTYNPQQQVEDNAGSGITNEYSPFLVESTNLSVTIAQGGDTNPVVLYISILE